MEELLAMVIGGIGALLAAVFAEGIGEAIGELFGAVAEAGGEAIAEAGGEAVSAIGESGTDAGMVAPLGAIAGETGDTGAEFGEGSDRIDRPLSTYAAGAGNRASNRDSRDSFEPAPATLSYRDKQELSMDKNGANPYLW